jgi:hypothetical protein
MEYEDDIDDKIKIMDHLKVFGLLIELISEIIILLCSWLFVSFLLFLKFALVSLVMFNYLPLSSIYNFKLEYIIICGMNEFSNFPNITIF